MLRGGDPRDARQRGSACCQMEKTSAGKFHFEPPFTSLDHLVGGHLHDRRHRQAERLSGLKIDHEFESCSLIDRQLSRLLALEDPSYVTSSSAIAISYIRSIAYQTACSRGCAGFISRVSRCA